MRYLRGREEQKALEFIAQAVEVAKEATCTRSKCGSVIVQRNVIIGSGYNSPARDIRGLRRCSKTKDSYDPKVTDKTCCVHAEQRAIMDALTNNPKKLPGSRLYFIRLDEDDNPTQAGEPYCTICSKMALTVNIAEFVLWKENGVCVYDTPEYDFHSSKFNRATSPSIIEARSIASFNRGLDELRKNYKKNSPPTE